MIPLSYPIGLSAILFSMGVIGVLTRRNAIIIFMSIELMLNSSNIAFISFSNSNSTIDGQIFVIFIIAIAAVEAVIGLSIFIILFRLKQTLNIDEINILKW